jgi:hypothetical protein
LARGIDAQIHSRIKGGIEGSGDRACLIDPRRRGLQLEIVTVRLLLEPIEVGIAKQRPPVSTRQQIAGCGFLPRAGGDELRRHRTLRPLVCGPDTATHAVSASVTADAVHALLI